MSGWAQAVQVFEKASKKKPNLKFFLLELDISGEKLNISELSKGQEKKKAIDDYAKVKKEIKERRNMMLFLWVWMLQMI